MNVAPREKPSSRKLAAGGENPGLHRAPAPPRSTGMSLPRRFPVIGSVFALLLAMFGTGCTTTTERADVAVALVGLRVAEVTPAQTTLVCTLRLQNEAVTALLVTSMCHRLILNGTTIGVAESDEAFGIPEMKAATREVTLRIANAEAIAALKSVLEKGVASYKIESRFATDMIDEKLVMVGRSSGVIDLHAAGR